MLGQLLISGIALGSIYALLALAMVLIHKATDVINFAQGEMAMFTTFVAWVLITALGFPVYVVLLLSFPIGAALGGIVQRMFIHPLTNAPPVNNLIVAIGLWIIFHNLAGWFWGFDSYRFPSLLPEQAIEIFGVRSSPTHLAIIAVAAGLLCLLYFFFEHTRNGTAMRAASMNRWAAQLMGIRVDRVGTLAWALAAGIGAVAGTLVAPVIFLDFGMMLSILLKAFAGAVLGGFNSLPGAVLGGVSIGVIESLFGAYVSDAFKDSLAFLIIVLILMFRPSGLFSTSGPVKV